MLELKAVESLEALRENIQAAGLLPFFPNPIPGLSIEEHTPRRLWFSDAEPGPWEWKGPAVRPRDCIYGKFFGGRAGFVSLSLAPDFLNLRRDGYDFDARYEDGLSSRKDKELMDLFEEHGALLTGELKRLGNYRKGGNKGFETVVTRLQMQGYLVISDFEYRRDKAGKTYGWGIARYATPESLFGADFLAEAYTRSPEESRARLLAFLRERHPHTDEALLRRLLG